jgi:hypothetical protein
VTIAPAVHLLIEVAIELNKIDWPPTIRLTEDFIVYAVDLEGGNLRKNVRAIVTLQQFAVLKAKKLI